MQQNKGKSATTSVPSIAIRFNATAEEIEELYTEGDDSGDAKLNTTTSATSSCTITNTASDPESSPLRSYLRLTKRSTSVDVSPISSQDASPPSDSWKFLSDIKSKITKSVEGRITEYKSKKEMESEHNKAKSAAGSGGTTKDQQPSESEEDESSISKTCGVISTSDGVELSSEDETSSERQKKVRPFKHVGIDSREPFGSHKVSDDEDEVEDGIEAVEDLFKAGTITDEFKEKWADFQEVDEDGLTNSFYKPTDNDSKQYVTFNPPHHVDLRPRPPTFNWFKFIKSFRYTIIFISIIGIKLYVELPDYLCGFISGSCVTMTIFLLHAVYSKVREMVATNAPEKKKTDDDGVYNTIPPVVEYTPLTKYEGWVNEYPQFYNPHTYHISETQSVYLKLRGNLLRVSHTKSKIPRRSMWNEPAYNVVLSHHRVYNLLGAKISLLPDGLARGKRWSKKYPICIALINEHENLTFKDDEHDEVSSSNLASYMQMSNLKDDADEEPVDKEEKDTGKATKKTRFAYDVDSHNGHEADTEDDPDNQDATSDDVEEDDDAISFKGEPVLDHETVDPHEPGKKTKLYVFGRTDREKEMWFRRFVEATHKGAQYVTRKKLNAMENYGISTTLIQDAKDMEEINKIMGDQYLYKEIYQAMNKEVKSHVKWLNLLAGRILFDCVRNPEFGEKIKERVQKKLTAIKLPYFIEDLVLAELNLGTDIPLIHNCSNPVVDDSGVWVDFEITYSGLVTIILNTKLNLLKITSKANETQGEDQPFDEKSHPMFNSDADDTAESSTDDEYARYPPALDATGYPVQGLGGTSTTSKKIIRIVDKVAESKFFQAAAENKYIKKAIENVSNTDLGLKLEIRALVATLVVNIPPPPSDRIWMSFRPLPKLQILATPIVGEKNFNHMKVTNFLEKKLIQEIHKMFVLPNMEDITFTLMSPKLPQ